MRVSNKYEQEVVETSLDRHSETVGDRINDQLIAWAKEGYAPQLVYDDNGHWAVSFDSFGPVDGAPEDVFTDTETIWCDTPLEAVLAAIPLMGDDG